MTGKVIFILFIYVFFFVVFFLFRAYFYLTDFNYTCNSICLESVRYGMKGNGLLTDLKYFFWNKMFQFTPVVSLNKSNSINEEQSVTQFNSVLFLFKI